MKRILCLLLTFALHITSFAFQTVFAADDIKVLVNGKSLTMDQPPVLVNDRTLVPVRAIFEALGAKVDWNNDTNTATGVLGSTTVEIQIENTVAKVNGKDVTLDVPAKLINDRTLVPVRFISESLGAKVDWDNDTQTVIITTNAIGETIFEMNFDNLTKFENNSEFITGAEYKPSEVSLSKDVDHTTGNGQSLKMANRTKADHRVKLKDAFKGAQKGKTYVVSAYVYSPEAAEKVGIGAYSDVGKANAFKPAASKEVNVAAKTWTKIEFEYTYDNEEITQVGIDQRPASSKCAPTLYMDDVKIYEGKLADSGNEPSTPAQPSDSKFSVSEVKNGHRPVPTNFTTGKGYEDLVFYEYGGGKSNDELIANLPKGTVMLDDSLLLKKAEENKTSEYGTIEIVDVADQPFKKAIRAKVTNLPKNPYGYQIDMGAPLEGKGTEGDVCLLKIYMRTLDGGNDESQNGQIQVVVEENGGQYTKSVTGNVTNGRSWNVAYFPFTFKNNYTRATVRLGYYLQTVEFGGYEIVNYGKNVSIDDMPTNAGNVPTLNKDAKWRKEAWDRIEKIRKGDIKVIVKDAQGNAVTDAKVDVNMYEHEFNFGTAVNSGVLSGDHASVIQKNFNSAVLENHTKWVEYEKNPSTTKALLEKLTNIGIKNLRGHVLVWDRGLEKTYDSATGKWKENTSVPEEIVKLTLANDKAGVQEVTKKHINEITSDLSKYISEWDVLNEACNNKELQDKYGREIINEWFDMAREALGKDAKLYYNDFKTNDELFALLDTMYKNKVDFDGIGLQSHYSSVVNIEDVIAFYNKLDEKYGKRLKITEYDFATNDTKLQGNYTRDILIASFAQESVDGFIMWGYKGGPGGRYVMYDNNWNEKPGLNAWQDLIYNKWWTQESGTTSADGSFSTRGYYGDYDITVTTKDGKTKTVSVPCYKGNDNTITITLD